jgi:hypothetical protein
MRRGGSLCIKPLCIPCFVARHMPLLQVLFSDVRHGGPAELAEGREKLVEQILVEMSLRDEVKAGR